jgi:hypothetical protein
MSADGKRSANGLSAIIRAEVIVGAGMRRSDLSRVLTCPWRPKSLHDMELADFRAFLFRG